MLQLSFELYHDKNKLQVSFWLYHVTVSKLWAVSWQEQVTVSKLELYHDKNKLRWVSFELYQARTCYSE